MNFANTEEAYTQLSNGGTLVSKFANLLFGYYSEENHTEIKSNEAIIDELRAAEARKAKLSGVPKTARASLWKVRTT